MPTPEHPLDPHMGQGSERACYADVTEAEISVKDMIAEVSDPRCGAMVTFDGIVRDHDGGKGVEQLDYSMHPTAPQVMAEILTEMVEKYPDVRIAAVHRVGHLKVGDTALAAAVAAPHRGSAFEACAELVEVIKKRLPIWKEQSFTDGSTEWVGALD